MVSFWIEENGAPEDSERGIEEEVAQSQSALHEAQNLNRMLQDEVSLLKSQPENE